jgi:hypothetical protein
MDPFMKPFFELLQEIYIGSEGKPTFVIDNDPGYGITAAIKTVSAKKASTPSHKGGSTIAAHTGHLKWSLDYAMEFYKGKPPTRDWKESWTRIEVDEQEWKQLQEDLLETYNKLVQIINGVKDWSNPDLLKGTVALLPHAAYHLGAIKQLMLVEE